MWVVANYSVSTEADLREGATMQVSETFNHKVSLFAIVVLCQNFGICQENVDLQIFVSAKHIVPE